MSRNHALLQLLRASPFLFLCLDPWPVLAQYSGLRFDHFSTQQGLSQDIVTAIMQDSQGFMWFGTEDGLNCYDGYSIKVYKYDPRDSTTLSSNGINDIFEDSHHRLWISTYNGLNFFDRDRDRFIRFGNNVSNPSSLSNNVISMIREDSHGSLWIGTNRGLNRYDEERKTFTHYAHNPADSSTISADHVVSLFLAKNGTLWITTTNGVCSYDEAKNRFTRYLFETRASHQRKILQLHEDRAGTLWVVHADHGIWRFDVVTNALKPIPEPVAVGVVNKIAEDDRGRLWIGHFGGLDVFDPTTRTVAQYVPDPPSPSGISGRVISIYKDRVGVMWLGTFHGGVNRCDPNRQKFLLYTNAPNTSTSLSGNYVSAVCEDSSGDVWVGSDGGVDRLNRGTQSITHYRYIPNNPNSLNSGIVNAILEDRRGDLWIGSDGGPTSGLSRYDRKRNEFIHYPITSVKSLFEDADGDLWIGKLNEHDKGNDIVRLDRNRSMVFRDSIAGTGVWCIYQDRRGYLWFGGQYCCLNRFDKRTNTFMYIDYDLNHPAKLSSGAVRAIYEDDEGYMWFGTWGGGLNRYDPRTNSYTRFLESDGLPSNFVKGILPDGRGNLWIATEKGLSRLDRKKITFKNFTTEDGLQGDRFLSGSCFKGRNGWMYFGGTDGLNLFHPDSIGDNPNIPPVVITSFKVFDRPFLSSRSVSNTKEIHLTYYQDFFSFEFVALDYTAPQRNQYAYMLEGFDRDWVDAGTRRYAAYTRLSPGEYTFRVRGSNNDRVWNNEGASIRLIIAPPFWMRWWFIVLVVAALTTGLFLLYRSRVKQLLALERLRARISSDLHDDVGTDLSSIVLATQTMEHTFPLSVQQRNEIRQIGRIALRTQEMMRDIVWVLNSRNDSLTDLILKMREVSARMLKEIPYTFKGPDSPLSEKIGLEFKRTIFLFYKECLNNILKHSGASHATIEVRVQQGEFLLRVTDDGKGFNPGSVGSGIGLQSLRSRAEHVGGRLDISSQEGTGTSISLVVKTP